MDLFELDTKAALADMWLHENKMLKEENAKLKEAAQDALESYKADGWINVNALAAALKGD